MYHNKIKIMKVRNLYEILSKLISNGDGYKDIDFCGIKRDSTHNSIFFQEEITTIHITTNNINEPIILCGDTYNSIITEKLVQLNWFGLLIRRFIIKTKSPEGL